MSCEIKKYYTNHLKAFTKEIILIKYGGNAMLDNELKNRVMNDICHLKELGIRPVLVHGGGPFIQKTLDMAGLTSEFIDGHRKTSQEAMMYVEMALKGQVNGNIVKMINAIGQTAIGLSGKDGKMAIATKRMYKDEKTGEYIDLGRVGDIQSIHPEPVLMSLNNGYIPVIASIAAGNDGEDYNVNADMFAGHLAASLGAKAYISMTNVDGVMLNPKDHSTLIREITFEKFSHVYRENIQGGMIPKLESCKIALGGGVETARIINGTTPHSIIKELSSSKGTGTFISKT